MSADCRALLVVLVIIISPSLTQHFRPLLGVSPVQSPFEINSLNRVIIVIIFYIFHYTTTRALVRIANGGTTSHTRFRTAKTNDRKFKRVGYRTISNVCSFSPIALRGKINAKYNRRIDGAQKRRRYTVRASNRVSAFRRQFTFSHDRLYTRYSVVVRVSWPFIESKTPERDISHNNTWLAISYRYFNFGRVPQKLLFV